MAESYAREITKRAVATAAIALDFKQSYSNVLESLSDVVRQYIEKISILSKMKMTEYLFSAAAS